jgi:hypothetical protein
MATVTEVNVTTGQIAKREMTPKELASYVQPTEDELKANCKSEAQLLLKATDWTEIPSVTNTANTPNLLNSDEFVTYRNFIRILAVNPVANPTWPPVPTEQWSS